MNICGIKLNKPYMIKNNTFYNGKIYLKLERYPYYSNSCDYLNKIHLDLKFIKLVSRIKSEIPNNYNSDILHDIAEQTNLKLVSSFYDYQLNNFETKDGIHSNMNTICINGSTANVETPNENVTILVHFTNESTNSYISPDSAFMAYNNNMIATDHDQIFAKCERNIIIGYCGYSHRAAVVFKIGDKLFNADWRPDDNLTETKENTPFTMHGYKTIETLEEAYVAASNFSRYVS